MPSLDWPIAWDLPMSLRLSLTPSWYQKMMLHAKYHCISKESDVDIPNAFSSDEDDRESDIQDEIDEEWSSQLQPVRVENFTEETGPVFPDRFDRTAATPLD